MNTVGTGGVVQQVVGLIDGKPQERRGVKAVRGLLLSFLLDRGCIFSFFVSRLLFLRFPPCPFLFSRW